MNRLERLMLCVVAALTLSVALFAASRNHAENQHIQQQIAADKPMTLPVAASDVLAGCADFQGDASSPYTLVEFADYQCPPCRETSKGLPYLLAKHPGKLRFAFRNFPLLNLHLYAMPAAVAAEVAREQGSFWPMHDALMQGDLDPAAVRANVEQMHLDRVRFSQACRTTAQAAVTRDAQFADHLHLSSTPTFLLCDPQGHVIRLGQAAQVEQFLPAH